MSVTPHDDRRGICPSCGLWTYHNGRNRPPVPLDALERLGRQYHGGAPTRDGEAPPARETD